MKLRTHLNLVVAGLSAGFVIVLLAAEMLSARVAIGEEIGATNIVATQLLGRLATVHPEGDSRLLREFLDELGRVRANDVTLYSPAGELLYQSPPATWKAGRDAPRWYARLLTPATEDHEFVLSDGSRLLVEAEPSRAVLDAWDDFLRLLVAAGVMLTILNGLAFWSVGRALEPFPVIADGLSRIQRGDLAFRLPPLPGPEARVIGEAFNAMAQGVQDKLRAERKAQDAETRLEERRELGRLVEQRVEEERRLIAHELHDEFSQSVTAIRSLALAISHRNQSLDAETADTARLIADEAAQLYDAMHGLIPRLAPLTLDTLGLGETLENLLRDWQRRRPSVALTLDYHLFEELGDSVTLALYRVVQEGLINALRHAHASRVDITLRTDDEGIVARVVDDGVGLPADWKRPGHFGLRGLTERVASLGGRLSIDNREPHGVELRAKIPLKVKAAA